MNPHYAKVAARAKHHCEYCRAPEPIFNFPFEVEHIVPLSRFGSGDFDNRALACRSCNLFKLDKFEAFDGISKCNVPIFNPRIDVWSEHFSIDVNSNAIVGLTAKGRATVSLLRFNSEMQVESRRHWRQLGIFK